MNHKSKLVEGLMSFCICTACITILEGVMGMLFFPNEKLGYEAFFHRHCLEGFLYCLV